MFYSITFTNQAHVPKNTWVDWHLIPSSPPMIEPPDPYMNYVEIPGRSLGPIDLTEALGNGPSFINSEGSWEFVSAIDHEDRPELYLELKRFLHGRSMKIELEEDPLHYYIGRIAVEKPRTGKGHNTYSFKYTISPVRYLLDGTIDDF